MTLTRPCQHLAARLISSCRPFSGCRTISMAAWGSHARQVQAAVPYTQPQRLWPCAALYRQPANRLQCHPTLAASVLHPIHTQRLHRRCSLPQTRRSLSGLNSSKSTKDHGGSHASQQSSEPGQEDDPASSQLSTPWSILPAAAQAPILTLFGFRQKIVAYLRESLLVAYTTLVENIIWGTAEVLRLDRALRWATPRLEQGLARATGQWHILSDGSREPASIVNIAAPWFDAPPAYQPPTFPFAQLAAGQKRSLQGAAEDLQRAARQPGADAEPAASQLRMEVCPELTSYDHRRAHFLAMCMKLVYERPACIEDIAQSRWGCTFLGFLQTAASDTDRLSANPTIPERRSRHQQQADQPSHRQAQEPTQGKQQEQPKQPDSQQSQQPQSSSQGQSHNGSQPQPAKHKTSRGREAPEDGEDGTRSETQTVSRFVPETGCFMLTTDGALIVSFRGTQPTNLVNFRSSGNISMRQWEGVGRVHNGFYEALMYRSSEQGSTLFERLVAALEEHAEGRVIYLTGHSLGGALAVVFAQALHAEGHKELSGRVAGMWTYGAPRIGDTSFCQQLASTYPHRMWRLVHGADVIPKIPPKFLEYCHPPKEVFLTSFGRVLFDEADISRWRRNETWFYLPLQLLKTANSLLRRDETVLRALERLALLLTLPGLSDHFPADYEMQLRRQFEIPEHKIMKHGDS